MALTDQLVSYWKLDEDTGTTAADSVRGGTPGSWQGTLGSQWGPGIINSGGVFDGSTNYIQLPYFNIGTTISYSLWYKFPTKTNQHLTLLSYMSTIFALNTTNSQFVWWGDDGQATAQFGSNLFTPMSVNTWYHTVITQTGTTTTVYFNGNSAPFINGTVHAVKTNNDSSQIGCYSNASGFFWNGSLDEIGIWTRVLTAPEVTQLYNNGAGLQYPFVLPVTNTGSTLLTLGIG